MWMVGGYNESSHHHHHPHHHPQVSLGPHDAFNAAATRKLRPLIPRPPVVFPSSTSCASAATTHSCNFGLYTGSDLFSLNHPLATAGGGGDHQGSNYKNKELSNINVSAVPQVVLSTSRWNPTPEQLRTLEDLYRRGTRTPSTEQIQRITAELRRYGKIEGKNVFYWFQNHKARERQKRRRELELLSHDPNQHHHEPVVERKERGPANGKQGFEGEQTRSHYSNASATHAQEAGVGESMQRAAAAAAKAGRRAAAAVSDHRSRHNTGRLFHLELDDERNATWHNHIPSSSTPFCYSASTNSPPTPPSMATCDITRIGTKTRRFIPSLKEPIRDTTKEYEADEVEEGSATLQLFPLRSQVESEVEEEDKSKERDDVHFFEFLPPKIN